MLKYAILLSKKVIMFFYNNIITSAISSIYLPFFFFLLFVVIIIIIIEIIIAIILLFSSQRNYESLKKFICAIQAHNKKKSYIVVIKRFKLIYSSNVKRKCVFMYERESITKRKFKIKSRKIENKKCECEFKINAIFKQHLNV